MSAVYLVLHSSKRCFKNFEKLHIAKGPYKGNAYPISFLVDMFPLKGPIAIFEFQ